MKLEEGQRSMERLQKQLTEGKITQAQHDKAVRRLIDLYLKQPVEQRQ